MGLYSLRAADRSVKLAVALFLVALGCAYVFAFLMVRTWAGLTPDQVAATYAPASSVETTSLPASGSVEIETLDLQGMAEEAHVVDVDLLIQDSHVHIMLYAIVAALESAIIFGLPWTPRRRDTVIAVAFLAGLLDFSGQWLVKAGIPVFSWLTIAAGWSMAAVYLLVAVSAARELAAGASREESR